MNRLLIVYLVWLVLTSSGLLPVGSAWPKKPQPDETVISKTGALASLVHRYLRADSTSQEEIKDLILSHPDANLNRITDIIKGGVVYDKMPVGILPSQKVRVKGQTFEYGLYVPGTYNPDSGHALILCLHGAGFSGDAYLDRWVPRLQQGYILACPTISMGAWWTRTGEDLVLATLHAVRSRYHIDPDRVFLTGMSNGGIGAWIIGMHQAPLWAGVAPMASGIDKVLYPFLDNLKQTPVYVIHGVQDQVMPVRLSRELDEEMTRRGIRHVYREHNRSHPHAGGHFFPREELPALVAWFDQQRRKALPQQLMVVKDATHLESFSWVRIDATDRIAAFSNNLIESEDNEYIKKGIYAKLQAKIKAPNRIVVTTHRVKGISVFLNEELVDLSSPVTVVINGRISYHQQVQPDLNTLLRQARLRQDSRMVFPIQLKFPVSP